MAYDPEARRQSNFALIIGLVSFLIAGGLALAYFATRRAPEPGPLIISAPPKSFVVENTDNNTVENQVEVPVENPATAGATPPESTTRNTTITHTIFAAPPASTGSNSNEGTTASATLSDSSDSNINGAPGDSNAKGSSVRRDTAPASPTSSSNDTNSTSLDAVTPNAAPVENAAGNAAPGY